GHVDAFLWIKRPGESDGSCDKGDPPAGTFVNQYVVDLAHNGGPVDLAHSAGH
ncbi:MAG: glycoside hydrolase family 6 protein, partial [Mycobacterium sp.]